MIYPNINGAAKPKIYFHHFIPLQVPIKSNSVCTSKGFRISEKQLCAGGEFGKSACRGDSGGGLFINDPGKETSYRKKEPWYLFGVVSFGSPNCEASVPEVYVR